MSAPAHDSIIARYRIETCLPLEQVAETIAGEQSSGTFLPVPGETEELKARARARVTQITLLDSTDAPSLPGGRSPRAVAGPLRYQRAEITLSFPLANLGANLPTLLATVCGNLYELSDHTGCKLLDLELPPAFGQKYPGPQFGVAGTRQLAGVHGRPIIGTIVKPSVGFTPEQTADLARELGEAGIDFIKDDELQADAPHCPLKARVAAVMRVINDLADRTGKKVMFAFNITDDLDAMLRHHDTVLAAGGTCVMTSLHSVGLPGLLELRRRCALPIHGHRNGWGLFTRHPLLGVEYPAWQKLWRLAGVDHLHVNGLQNKFLQHENWGYLDLPRSFAELIAGWNERRYGVTVDPETIVVATGVHPAIIAALQAFSPAGSKVLLQTPTYNGFYSDISFARCVPEESPLRLVDGRYSMDLDDLERRIGHDTHTLILCNPQNPTGNCWTRDDLLRLGELCLRRRVVVVLADEIHCDFVSKGQSFTPFRSLPDKAVVRNSITFNAASKSFGLAAMKCGWFFSDNADYMARVKACHRADLTTLGVVASRAAYTGGEDWLNQVVPYIDGNLDFVDSFVRSRMPLLKFVKPQGTYLAWLDVAAVAEKLGAKQQAAEANRKKAASTPVVSPEKIVEQFFVKHARVHLNAGTSYGRGGENHMRMNAATSRKLLQLALTNMAVALDNL